MRECAVLSNVRKAKAHKYNTTCPKCLSTELEYQKGLWGPFNPTFLTSDKAEINMAW